MRRAGNSVTDHYRLSHYTQPELQHPFFSLISRYEICTPLDRISVWRSASSVTKEQDSQLHHIRIHYEKAHCCSGSDSGRDPAVDMLPSAGASVHETMNFRRTSPASRGTIQTLARPKTARSTICETDGSRRAGLITIILIQFILQIKSTFLTSRIAFYKQDLHSGGASAAQSGRRSSSTSSTLR